ncbi:trimeric LpxA-like protein [Hyaloraphidium curvatum]|nr:trimeric LpxA-like protein [Hyaloraphidium curvatum]
MQCERGAAGPRGGRGRGPSRDPAIGIPPLVLFRCGGKQAGVTLDALGGKYADSAEAGRAAAWDEGPALHRTLAAAGFVHLRTADDARAFCGAGPVDAFVCHGKPAVRKRLACELRAELARARLRFPVAVHPTAYVAPTAALGEGTFVGYHAAVGNAAIVGRFCMLSGPVTFSHDTLVGDYPQASGGAMCAGGASLGEGVWLGMGAVVRDGARVADWSMIGMHARVVRDIVEPGWTWVGTPARPLRRGGTADEGAGREKL